MSICPSGHTTVALQALTGKLGWTLNYCYTCRSQWRTRRQAKGDAFKQILAQCVRERQRKEDVKWIGSVKNVD